ncbi:MAG: D-Ala-D-Ala carboxypeptidase family metallohydrolase [Cyanobacteria bacterium P01_C01_bin.73]
MMKIRVVSDTLFKSEPKLSGELSEENKVFVKTGTEFEIQFYVDVANGHLRVSLANAALGTPERKDWYVYRPDIELVSSPVQLTVVSDTLFKLEPVVSSKLSDREKIFVKNGTQFDLQSYLPAEGNHVRVAIANAFLGPENRNTWYAYNPDVDIDGSVIELRVVGDTLFKTEPRLSSELADDQKLFVKTGTTFEIESHSPANSNHIEVVLKNVQLQSRSTWYAYAPDVEIEGNEPDNQPKDSQEQPSAGPKDLGKALTFPGFNGTYYTNQPILANGNFTWGEATHGGSRIPVNASVVYGMIRIAKKMETVRQRLGNRPIKVNSWYRDPATNRRVGGASRSRHLSGDAIDFVVSGIHPYDVYAKLDAWWGSQGGLASATVFTHIDARGYRARWSYGF